MSRFEFELCYWLKYVEQFYAFTLPWRATRSVSSRLTFLNFSWRTSRGSKGLGRFLALSTLVVVPSRRPSSTLHRGPLAYTQGSMVSSVEEARTTSGRSTIRAGGVLTSSTEISAARARMSAQETTRRARVLERGLDVVHHGKAAGRVVVGGHGLLGLDRREVVVQQKRAVATLNIWHSCMSDQ